jgi:hypothetical protein
MVSVLALRAVDHVASPLTTQHYGERAKTGWIRIRIKCPSVYLWTVVSVSSGTIKIQLSMLV